MDGWNTTFLLGSLIFRGYVSFREDKRYNFGLEFTCALHVPGAICQKKTPLEHMAEDQRVWRMTGRGSLHPGFEQGALEIRIHSNVDVQNPHDLIEKVYGMNLTKAQN